MNWPVLAICFILSYILTGRVLKSRKHNAPPRRTEQQKQADELITTILPIIDPKN